MSLRVTGTVKFLLPRAVGDGSWRRYRRHAFAGGSSMVAGDRQRSFLNDMHRARPTSGAAIVPALLLGACSGPATADPCVTDGVQTDPPVACAGSNLAVLAQYEFPSERWTAQIGASHQAIALDATDVYWSDVGGRALRTPKNGG